MTAAVRFEEDRQLIQPKGVFDLQHHFLPAQKRGEKQIGSPLPQFHPASGVVVKGFPLCDVLGQPGPGPAMVVSIRQGSGVSQRIAIGSTGKLHTEQPFSRPPKQSFARFHLSPSFVPLS